MQMAFQKDVISCMQPLLRDTQTQEQTQEVRIGDGMPDIGRILCCWGQVILRGKEWDTDTAVVNGGTMAWVQYLPEEGGDPETVACWLPFQMRWNLPQTQQEGILLTQVQLKSVDARSTSARKMIIRTNVSVLLQAMETCQKEISLPDGLPEDVQLHTLSYPVMLTAEAGEKTFSLDESFSLQGNGMQPEKLCAYWMQPQITEYRLMGDKAVFRGNASLQTLYRSQDGKYFSGSYELPFSQYSELESEYGDDADAVFWPAVTSLEAELEEGTIHVRAGLTGQYEIRSRPVIRVVTDAYSPCRDVELKQQLLELPGILESKKQILHAKSNTPAEGIQAAAVQFLSHGIAIAPTDTGAQLTLQGNFQNLLYDLEGAPNACAGKWEQQLQIPMGEGCSIDARLLPTGIAQSTMLSGQLQQQADLILETDTRMNTGISMVTGLELGELRQPDPDRPSLILRKAGAQSLWDLAKASGATVEDIQKANDLAGEPEPEQMLLIPVM